MPVDTLKNELSTFTFSEEITALIDAFDSSSLQIKDEIKDKIKWIAINGQERKLDNAIIKGLTDFLNEPVQNKFDAYNNSIKNYRDDYETRGKLNDISGAIVEAWELRLKDIRKKEEINFPRHPSIDNNSTSSQKGKKATKSSKPKSLKEKYPTFSVAWRAVFHQFWAPQGYKGFAKYLAYTSAALTFIIKAPLKLFLELPLKWMEINCLYDRGKDNKYSRTKSNNLLRLGFGHLCGMVSSLVRYTISFNPYQSAAEASSANARPAKFFEYIFTKMFNNKTGEAAGRFASKVAGFFAGMLSLGGIVATTFGGPAVIASATGAVVASIVSVQTLVGASTALPFVFVTTAGVMGVALVSNSLIEANIQGYTTQSSPVTDFENDISENLSKGRLTMHVNNGPENSTHHFVYAEMSKSVPEVFVGAKYTSGTEAEHTSEAVAGHTSEAVAGHASEAADTAGHEPPEPKTTPSKDLSVSQKTTIKQ